MLDLCTGDRPLPIPAASLGKKGDKIAGKAVPRGEVQQPYAYRTCKDMDTVRNTSKRAIWLRKNAAKMRETGAQWFRVSINPGRTLLMLEAWDCVAMPDMNNKPEWPE